MKTACCARDIVMAWAALGWLAAAAPASAQDPLAPARELYALARYEEALGVLDRLRAGERAASAHALSVERYRSLCLLALGRDGEAEAAIAAVVSIDPFYLPDAKDVAPSVRTFFQGVRARLLPGIAQARYAEAKAAYEDKQFARAAEGFHRVVALVDDPDMGGKLADLRVLADGFEQLSAAAAAPPPPGPPEAAPPPPEPPPEPAAPPAPRVYGSEDAGVTLPIVVRQVLPPVPTGIQAVGRTRGLYEITIDEAGRVAAVTIRASLHAVYDRAFIESAVTWQYRPALLDGRPVKYRKRFQVSVAR